MKALCHCAACYVCLNALAMAQRTITMCRFCILRKHVEEAGVVITFSRAQELTDAIVRQAKRKAAKKSGDKINHEDGVMREVGEE